MTESESLLSSAEFRAAKNGLLAAIASASARIRVVRSGDGSAQAQYAATLKAFTQDRGRDLYFPFLSSGIGSGPLVELADGSVKFDMITGIGINFFGHSHPALMAEVIDAVPADVMQGNLEPGVEAAALLRAILEKTGPRLNHGWLMCSGTMANEVALKIIRQKRQPASKILAFRDSFHGRSTAMQELTDNPGYRQGQPVYGEVEYLPHYDSQAGLQSSLKNTLAIMREQLARYPGKFAGLLMEVVQGEGGFTFGPREFYVGIFEEARKAGIAIWIDEVQTFGRTGELFAFQKFGLSEYVDVVTAGKMLQACLVLYSDEYNPKPGLVAGTFSGSTVALRTSKRVLSLLQEGGFLGSGGKIEKLSALFASGLAALAKSSGKIGEIRVIGGMVAFAPYAGKMDEVKGLLMKLFDKGVVAFYCGHGPYFVRMLPPLGAMTEKDVDEVLRLIGECL
jgi:4-aminobutyrate aminotransferase-like enzyme